MSRKKDTASGEGHNGTLDPLEDPTSIGNILLKLGKITPQQLANAVGERALFDEMVLAALLKNMGFVSDMDLAKALKVQAELRQGNALNAELDVLESTMEESERGAKELSSCLANVRNSRRDRGEQSGVFFLPTAVRARS